MKTCILLFLFTTIFCGSDKIIFGKCGMAPKRRPVSCYTNTVLPEDIPELTELLEKFKDGDDNEFANYLGDMIDKKAARESNGQKNDEDLINQPIGACGMAPQYLPFRCYEVNVLRRDKKTLSDAYDKYHKSDLKAFNKVYTELEDKKQKYYGTSSKN